MSAVALLVVVLLGASAANSAGASRGTVVVPRTGSDVLTAYARLHKAGLRVSIPHAWSYDSRRPPRVVRLSPAAGRRVRRGAVVTLTLACCGRSGGPRGKVPKATVPPFVMSAASVAYSWVARKAVFTAHLSPLRAGNTSGLLLNYRVTRQTPAPGKPLTPLTVWGTQAAPCALPPGSKLIARNADAVLITHAGRGGHDYYGCLKTAGAQQRLTYDYNQYGNWQAVQQTLLSGRYAAFALRSIDHYETCVDSVILDRIDGGTPSLAVTDKPGQIFSTGCNAQTDGIDSLQLNSRGFSAWRDGGQIPPTPLSAVSCPSPSLCVAVDTAGNVIASSNPLGGRTAWTSAAVDPGNSLTGISCPSASLCVAVGTNGRIVRSTDPLGGQGAWTGADVDPRPGSPAGVQLSDISCPAVLLCVAVDQAGNVLTSTNPAGGPAAWTVAHVGAFALQHVSCPSTSLCVATDVNRDVLTSTNPAGGAAAWTVTHLTAEGSLNAISCPSTTLCVAGGSGGELFTSTNPTGGSAAWTAGQVPATSGTSLGFVQAIACPSTTLCVAGDSNDNLLSTTNPAGGGPAWTASPDPTHTPVTGMSCPSTSLCVAGTDIGTVFTSTTPTAGSASWSSTLIYAPATCSDPQVCLTSEVYAHDNHGSRLLDPGVPGPTPSVTNLKLVGNVLSWQSSGTTRQATLR